VQVAVELAQLVANPADELVDRQGALLTEGVAAHQRHRASRHVARPQFDHEGHALLDPDPALVGRAVVAQVDLGPHRLAVEPSGTQTLGKGLGRLDDLVAARLVA